MEEVGQGEMNGGGRPGKNEWRRWGRGEMNGGGGAGGNEWRRWGRGK
jgi:hypothetical protein